MAKVVPCPLCPKMFGDENALWQHARTTHRDKDVAHLRPARKRDDDEPSLAEIAVEAHVKRLMGEPLDPLEESLIDV